MIKQFTVENIYNFKNEVTLDFTLSKNDGLYHVYHKDKISNTSVMYGKNNVGKSNLFKALQQSIDLILNNNLKLQPYYPDGTNENSVFEIIVENENYEIRYGFELLINDRTIIDEWMYSKVYGSTRESLIFNRADSKYSKYFNKNQLATFDNLVASKLIVNHCRSLKEQPEVINSFLEMLDQFTFMSCINKDDADLLPSIFSYHESPQIKRIMNAFLETSDLDIVSIDTQELSESENLLFETLRKITDSDLPEEEKREMNKKLTSENLELFTNLLSKNLIVRQDGLNKEDTVFVQFTHKNGAKFTLEELSSGTRQILSIILMTISKIGTNAILIFDEIETGLHIDLVNLLMDLFEIIIEKSPELQIIITTHQASLLDYGYIPKENKAFMKKQKEGFIEIDYLSNYSLREYEKPSNRYNLDAFQTNPNTSSEYKLKTVLMQYEASDK